MALIEGNVWQFMLLMDPFFLLVYFFFLTSAPPLKLCCWLQVSKLRLRLQLQLYCIVRIYKNIQKNATVAIPYYGSEMDCNRNIAAQIAVADCNLKPWL